MGHDIVSYFVNHFTQQSRPLNYAIKHGYWQKICKRRKVDVDHSHVISCQCSPVIGVTRFVKSSSAIESWAHLVGPHFITTRLSRWPQFAEHSLQRQVKYLVPSELVFRLRQRSIVFSQGRDTQRRSAFNPSPFCTMSAKSSETNGTAPAEPQFERITVEQFSAMSLEEREKLSLSQRKKLTKLEKLKANRSAKEAEAKARSEAEYQARLERARQITISEDASLPPANLVRIRDLAEHVDARVKVFAGCTTCARTARSCCSLTCAMAPDSRKLSSRVPCARLWTR